MEAAPLVAYLDESCLVNDRNKVSPGGAAGLLEGRADGGVARQEFSLAHPNTTNNRMALRGAIETLRLVRTDAPRGLLIVSDSEYLVRGIREWVPGWIARGWRRKGGPIENLELWQELTEALRGTRVQFTWVRGHAGHPKNEYADALAVRAAQTQGGSDGLVPSRFLDWLTARRAVGVHLDYDPDAAFGALERRLLAGERFLLDAGA